METLYKFLSFVLLICLTIIYVFIAASLVYFTLKFFGLDVKFNKIWKKIFPSKVVAEIIDINGNKVQ